MSSFRVLELSFPAGSTRNSTLTGFSNLGHTKNGQCRPLYFSNSTEVIQRTVKDLSIKCMVLINNSGSCFQNLRSNFSMIHLLWMSSKAEVKLLLAFIISLCNVRSAAVLCSEPGLICSPVEGFVDVVYFSIFEPILKNLILWLSSNRRSRFCKVHF